MADRTLDEGTREWIKAIIAETARATAQEVIDRHERACGIHALKADVWGLEGEMGSGLKAEAGRAAADLRRHSADLKSLREILSRPREKDPWWLPVLQGLIQVALMSLIGWMMSMYVLHAQPPAGAATNRP